MVAVVSDGGRAGMRRSSGLLRGSMLKGLKERPLKGPLGLYRAIGLGGPLLGVAPIVPLVCIYRFAPCRMGLSVHHQLYAQRKWGLEQGD